MCTVQVSIMHDCRHPNVVLMLGAWLGAEQLYMVMELMHTDLLHALRCPAQQATLRWDARRALLPLQWLFLGAGLSGLGMHGHGLVLLMV